MSEMRGIVRNPRTLRTDRGTSLTFGLIPREGREVPVESSKAEELSDGEEIIVTGVYDNEGTLKADAISKLLKPVTLRVQPAPEKLHTRLMLLAALLGDLAALVIFFLFAHTDLQIGWFLYIPFAVVISLLLSRLFLRKELRAGMITEELRKRNVRLACISSLVLPVINWLLWGRLAH